MTDLPSDNDLLTLTVCCEAAGEIADGQAAVVRVIQNRQRLHYQSDGTLRGTILHKSAFSEFGFDWVKGTPQRAAHYAPAPDAYTPARVAAMLKIAKASKAWAKCSAVVASVLSGHYVGDAAYDHLTGDAVLYVNLNLVHPAWATPAKFVTAIGHHSFYKG